MKTLSIIVPLYNKEKQIQKTLDSISSKCNELGLVYEIIIIENESLDNSHKKAEEWVSKNILPVTLYKSKKGLGSAIKLGIEKSKNNYITIIPADYTFGESELNYFHKNNSSLAKYIIGSRSLKESVAPAKLNRKIITVGFNFLKKLILNLKYNDTQGTFIIENLIAKKLANQSISTQFFITTEFIFRALKSNIEIVEIPITINIDEENKSTVKLVSDSIEMFFSMLKLRKLEGKLKK